MRTPEQILEQMEARISELRERAESPDIRKPCSKCEFCSGVDDVPEWWKCNNPLHVGFDKKWVEAWDSKSPTSYHKKNFEKHPSALCGPEKAMWRPKPHRETCWSRFLAFLGIDGLNETC